MQDLIAFTQARKALSTSVRGGNANLSLNLDATFPGIIPPPPPSSQPTTNGTATSPKNLPYDRESQHQRRIRELEDELKYTRGENEKHVRNQLSHIRLRDTDGDARRK